MIAHGIELAAWVAGFGASTVVMARAPRWDAAWWAGIAGVLCNGALIANHV